ncbi:MAG: S-layer homology domain-containing protein [Oscillospiraceae bacterium]|nr:S-layer homology domain-containing protein [Oscillospiraceae bacterium]
MQKKFMIMILIAALLLPLLGQAEAATLIPTAYGIDVSHHQGEIDWDTVATQIDFAILRCGYGSDTTAQDDRQWQANVAACTRLKIPFGVYIYSYATNEEQARSEARHVLRLLKGYSPSMPVYLDLEDQKISEGCTPEQILKNATGFCDMIKSAGYTPGIYANTYWWTNYLSSPQYDKWDRWVARYAAETGYSKPYSMWQYTDKGTVKGINGNVDMNRWYGQKPTVDCSHSYSAQITKEPDCTQSGIMQYTCKHCGHSYEEQLPAKGHSYSETQVPPTCTQGGYSLFRCHCGSSYEGSYTAAKGHVWDQGTITKEPTATQTGEKVYACENCDLTMTVTLPSTGSSCKDCPSAAFTDAPAVGNWAHEGVDFVLKKGLFQGVSEDRFAPEGTMNRAMLVTVLWRYAENPTAGSSSFTDVPAGEWYEKAVAWAAESGLVSGVGENRFNPKGNITREQLATILYRYCKSQGMDMGSAGDLKAFSDGEQVSAYAQEPMAWAVSYGLINGIQSEGLSYLKPQGSATRAQTATILQRWIETLMS